MLDFEKVYKNKRAEIEKKISTKDMETIKKKAVDKIKSGRLEEEKDVPISKEELEKEIKKVKEAHIDGMTLQALDKVVKKSIGQRIAKIREGKGHSQEDVIMKFAFVPDMDKSVLSRWENGERGINFFFLLWFAKEYNVDLQYLLTGEKKEPSSRVVPELQKKLEEILELFQKM